MTNKQITKERFDEWESIEHFCQGAERESFTFQHPDWPLIPSSCQKKKSKQKVKSRTVSRVNRCRVVCLSVCLAIKTLTLLLRSQWSLKRTGVLTLLWVFKMLSPSLKKIIYNLPQLIQQIQNIKMVSLPGAAPNIGGQYLKKTKNKKKAFREMERATGR